MLLYFSVFSEYFPVILGFTTPIHIRIHHHFSTFFECWLVGFLQWPPLILVFRLDETCSYATGHGTTVQQHDQHSKHWQTYSVQGMPVTKGSAGAKTFALLEKCVGHSIKIVCVNSVCIADVFVDTIDVKCGPPSDNYSPPWCAKVVTGLV